MKIEITIECNTIAIAQNELGCIISKTVDIMTDLKLHPYKDVLPPHTWQTKNNNGAHTTVTIKPS